jgi:hypothetical protein
MFWTLFDGIKSRDVNNDLRDLSSVFNKNITYDDLKSIKSIKGKPITFANDGAYLFNTESAYTSQNIFKRDIIEDFKVVYPEAGEYLSFANKRYGLKIISSTSFNPHLPFGGGLIKHTSTVFNPKNNEYFLVFDKSKNLVYANNVAFMGTENVKGKIIIVPKTLESVLSEKDIMPQRLEDVLPYVSEREVLNVSLSKSAVDNYNLINMGKISRETWDSEITIYY